MAERVERFAALHRKGAPFLLPNAWDVASAWALADAGFTAIGTTSLGVAAAAGKRDATGEALDETLRLAAQLANLRAMVTIDLEGGFSDDPDEVAHLARQVAGTGAIGVNLEDGRPDGTLCPVGVHEEKIRAVRRSTGLFVNARTDTFWLRDAPPGRSIEETLRRLERYVDAGASGVFVPGLSDLAHIKAVSEAIEAPLNVLFGPGGHSLAELGQAGVARVSTGSLLFRASLGCITTMARRFASGQRPGELSAPSYGEVQAGVPVLGGGDSH